jgi:hypothetical protein
MVVETRLFQAVLVALKGGRLALRGEFGTDWQDHSEREVG